MLSLKRRVGEKIWLRDDISGNEILIIFQDVETWRRKDGSRYAHVTVALAAPSSVRILREELREAATLGA